MTPEITPAASADLSAIFELLDANKLPRAGLERHVGSTLVAREPGRVVGAAALELYGRAALLRSVVVSTDWRGRGLGHALTTAALDLARRRGARTVYLLTETAATFFPKLGFQAIDRAAVEPAVLVSEQFTTACPTTALVMVRHLAPTPET
jgi:amino-acid N-acetyltransferase